MCDLADEICPVWQVNRPRARKMHKCMACEEPVAPGQSYRVTEFLFDGSWTRWKHCERCYQMFEAIRTQSSDILAIDPFLDCGEIWENPPEDIAALAFALPSDFEGQPRP